MSPWRHLAPFFGAPGASSPPRRPWPSTSTAPRWRRSGCPRAWSRRRLRRSAARHGGNGGMGGDPPLMSGINRDMGVSWVWLGYPSRKIPSHHPFFWTGKSPPSSYWVPPMTMENPIWFLGERRNKIDNDLICFIGVMVRHKWHNITGFIAFWCVFAD